MTSTSTAIQTVTTTTASPTTITVTRTQAAGSAMNGSVRASVGTDSSIAILNGAWDGGYTWEVTSIDNQSVVRLVGNETYTPPSNGLVGGPANTQIFTFEALKAGSAVVTLQLVRPWESNAPIARYVVYFAVA